MSNESNLIPFKPGQSGNPAGKKPGTRNRSTVVRELLEVIHKTPDSLMTLNPDLTGNYSTEQLMTLAQIEQAIAGDTQAYKAVMDSAYGTPKQFIEADLNVSESKGATLKKWTAEDVAEYEAWRGKQDSNDTPDVSSPYQSLKTV